MCPEAIRPAISRYGDLSQWYAVGQKILLAIFLLACKKLQEKKKLPVFFFLSEDKTFFATFSFTGKKEYTRWAANHFVISATDSLPR